MGNESGSGCKYGVKRRSLEGLSFSPSPWVVSKFIFLKAGVWLRHLRKALQYLIPSFFRSVSNRMGRWTPPLPHAKSFLFQLCSEANCPYPFPPQPVSPIKRNVRLKPTVPSHSLTLLPPPLTPYTILCTILLSAASRPTFLGQLCLCLPRQRSLQRQKKGQMSGLLGQDPTSCVLVFQNKLSGFASMQSPLPSLQILFLSLKKWLCQPQEKPLAQGKPGLRSCHQTPLSVSWDHCQGSGILAGVVEGPCSDPICSE